MIAVVVEAQVEKGGQGPERGGVPARLGKALIPPCADRTLDLRGAGVQTAVWTALKPRLSPHCPLSMRSSRR